MRVKQLSALDQVKEICDELSSGLSPHPDVTEEEWSEWLEGFQGVYREPCPKCGGGVMLEKTGRFGDFKGCSEYPRCKHTSPPDDF